MPVFVQQEIWKSFWYVAPTSRPVCDWESQSKLSPFGSWRPWSFFLGMAGLFAFVKLLIVILTYLFFEKFSISGHQHLLISGNHTAHYTIFCKRYLWKLLAGLRFGVGSATLVIRALLERVAWATLFPLLEAVQVGICNSAACRWTCWSGLWLLLACGGRRWSVSCPPHLPLTFCIQQ